MSRQRIIIVALLCAAPLAACDRKANPYTEEGYAPSEGYQDRDAPAPPREEKQRRY